MDSIRSIGNALPDSATAVSARPAKGFRQLYERESAGQDLSGAARQFEALILGQILKSAQTADQFGSVDGEGDPSGATMMEIAQEYLAQAIAAQGGLGVGRMVASSLSKARDATPPIHD